MEYQYPIPVVRLILRDSQNRILILKRSSTDHEAGCWCLPGGKIEYGQKVTEAIVVELQEETGLEVVNSRFLFYQDSLPFKPGGMHCINFYFECTVKGTIHLNQESSEYTWAAPQDLPGYKLAFRNYEALDRYWRLESC